MRQANSSSVTHALRLPGLADTHTYPYLYTQLYIYTHIHIYIHIYIHRNIFRYTYLYIYLYTCIHTYIHINIYIVIYVNVYITIPPPHHRGGGGQHHTPTTPQGGEGDSTMADPWPSRVGGGELERWTIYTYIQCNQVVIYLGPLTLVASFHQSASSVAESKKRRSSGVIRVLQAISCGFPLKAVKKTPFSHLMQC